MFKKQIQESLDLKSKTFTAYNLYKYQRINILYKNKCRAGKIPTRHLFLPVFSPYSFTRLAFLATNSFQDFAPPSPPDAIDVLS